MGRPQLQDAVSDDAGQNYTTTRYAEEDEPRSRAQLRSEIYRRHAIGTDHAHPEYPARRRRRATSGITLIVGEPRRSHTGLRRVAACRAKRVG